MRLRVLGSNGTYPTAGRPASGYLLTGSFGSVLLDIGPGVAMALADVMDPAELDALVVSHVHPDHCSDLFALVNLLSFGPSGREGLPVFAPAHVFERFAAFYGSGTGHRMFRVLDARPVAAGERHAIPGAELAFGAAVHPVPAVVTRIAAGDAVLAYSGDTGPGGDLVEMAAGAGVLLVEATHQGIPADDRYPYHLFACEAGRAAVSAGVRHLVLTHLAPTLDPERSAAEAAGTFSGSITVAVPGLEIDV